MITEKQQEIASETVAAAVLETIKRGYASDGLAVYATETAKALIKGFETVNSNNETTVQARFVVGQSLKLALALLPELLESRLQFIEGPLSFADIVTCHLNSDTASGANEKTITAEVSESCLSLLAALGARKGELELIRKARHGISSCC